MANICAFFFFFFFTSNSAQFIDAPRYPRETFDYLSSFALNLRTISFAQYSIPWKILFDESFKERKQKLLYFPKIYPVSLLTSIFRIELYYPQHKSIYRIKNFFRDFPSTFLPTIRTLISDVRCAIKTIAFGTSMLFIKFLECIFDSNILRCIDSLSLSRIMIFVYIFKKSIYNGQMLISNRSNVKKRLVEVKNSRGSLMMTKRNVTRSNIMVVY